MIKTDLPSRTR